MMRNRKNIGCRGDGSSHWGQCGLRRGVGVMGQRDGRRHITIAVI